MIVTDIFSCLYYSIESYSQAPGVSDSTLMI